MDSTVAHRLKNSRLHKGLSQQQVAEFIGVSKQMVNKYEQGKSLPGSEKIIQLSKLFNQKPDYFFRQPAVEIGEISFRKKSGFGIKRINILKEEIRIRIENYLYIENILNLNRTFHNPLSDFSITGEDEVRRAATLLKDRWDIGKDSLYNIIELFEEKHIKVIELDEPSDKFDGLATWADGQHCIIAISRNLPVERKRFTLLHELGHLVLNITSFEEKQQEKFCHYFASEMLLSAENLVEEFGEHRSRIAIKEINNVQKKYGISFLAVVYKLQHNGIISKNRVEALYKRINSDPGLKAFVNKSLYEGTEHSNRYENLVFRAVAEEEITLSRASSLLGTTIAELNERLTFNIG